ncbi:hypothetical protein STFE110948_02420 [Streptobacillus felis]|uniref:hypothetical protein n=1 Tax=Streptobacillus felis TaxID=1384509 RepID=UPI00082DD64D|nr:hypothetical protein [Streptobacillus felis]
MKNEKWKDKLKHINVPNYVMEQLEEYFQYVKENNKFMISIQIDDVLSNLNVANQENDLTIEEIMYVRSILGEDFYD